MDSRWFGLWVGGLFLYWLIDVVLIGLRSVLTYLLPRIMSVIFSLIVYLLFQIVFVDSTAEADQLSEEVTLYDLSLISRKNIR